MNIAIAQFRGLINDILNGDESARERAKDRARYIRNVSHAIGYLRSVVRGS